MHDKVDTLSTLVSELRRSAESPYPKRRFRGVRRHFRNVHRDAAAFTFHPGPEDWWDSWHYHADWRGHGDLHWRYRKEYFKVLATVYKTIAAVVVARKLPVQVWIQTGGRGAGDDAVFVHSKNGNGTAFPHSFPELKWGVPELMPFFQELLPNMDVRIGQMQFFDEYREPEGVVTQISVYCADVGVSLEAN